MLIKAFSVRPHTQLQNKPHTTTLITLTYYIDCKFHAKIMNLHSKLILCSLLCQYIPQGHFTEGVMGEAQRVMICKGPTWWWFQVWHKDAGILIVSTGGVMHTRQASPHPSAFPNFISPLKVKNCQTQELCLSKAFSQTPLVFTHHSWRVCNWCSGCGITVELQ